MDAKTSLHDARLYLCTDSRQLDASTFGNWCATLFEAGVDIIQLRDKSMEAARELEYFAALREAAAAQGKLFAANDRADIAQLSGAQVLHLGQGDLSLADARRLLGPAVLLGQSTHNLGQAQHAMLGDADYYCIGPVWPTPTKPGRPAAGTSAVAAVAAAAKAQAPNKPWFAIGDISLEKLPELTALGVARIAVVRAITEAPDPAEAAAKLKKALCQ